MDAKVIFLSELLPPYFTFVIDWHGNYVDFFLLLVKHTKHQRL
ncbi:hypothetical protein CLV98_101715 [Dyadobacter jejuensis]|uniref:Uncharacterized protein n=1 Tax=Dyadobacter jejuensis TaxID=1082580 RepID=A0A316AV05_9BACT|nr:hypothetical protein CLV98_101715 [Dyadobacter jejuensis]